MHTSLHKVLCTLHFTAGLHDGEEHGCVVDQPTVAATCVVCDVNQMLLSHNFETLCDKFNI